MSDTAESRRLAQRDAGTAPWGLWGPYLSERQWGTVREDYSPDGMAWTSFPHDHARSRAYRWGEDGLAGISDEKQRLCLALALWNGRDPILKERMFGLSGPEGNHGEDVKEYYWYLDSTPTHSFMRMLYKYPQAPFPYHDLMATNARSGKDAPEYELIDTGVFAEDRYWDVFVEDAGVEQLVLELRSGPFAIGADQVLVRVRRLRVLVEHPHVGVGRRAVEVEVVLLDVLAVVALRVGEPEQPLLQNRVAPVPKRKPEAQQLQVVADTREPVLAPAVNA